MKHIATILFFAQLCAAQWKPFVEQYGSMPSDLFSPQHDIELKTQWYKQVRPVLDRYASLVMLELQCRGFTLERVDYDTQRLHGASAWGWIYGATVSRGGLSVPFQLTERSPLHYDPAQMAEHIEQIWSQVREGATSAPWMPLLIDGARVTDWMALFLWTPRAPACRVYYTPGQACAVDLAGGSVSVEP